LYGTGLNPEKNSSMDIAKIAQPGSFIFVTNYSTNRYGRILTNPFRGGNGRLRWVK
jgi:hypothetical protein